MTRLLCAADIHLGAGPNLSTNRLADQELTLVKIFDLAREENVDGLLLAGDIFHRPRPAPETLLVFRRFTRLLEQHGIPTIACTGNAGHDIENGDRPCALDLFASDWFRVSRKPEMIRAAGDVAVCTLPSVPVARRVAAHDGGDRTTIFEETAELLVQTARDLRGEVPDGWPSILLGHWSVSGASLPNGLLVADLHETVLPIDGLEEIWFDAIVMGHIHKTQKLGAHVGSFYCGSPHVVDFGEASVDHGAWLLEIDDQGGVNTRFVPLHDRPFVTVDVDLTDTFAETAAGSDETDRIATAITLPVQGAVVRLRYRATEEQHRRVDRQALLGFLEEAGVDKVHGPTWEPVRATRARAAVGGDGMTDHDALQMWIDAVRLGEEAAGNVHALLDQYEAAAS